MKKKLFIIAISLTLVFTTTITAFAKSIIPWTDLRYAGNDRYLTSYAVMKQLYNSNGKKQFVNVVVADGRKFPDALSGGFLANRRGAPIVLVEKKTETRCINEIKKYATSGATIYILGGTSAVSSNFEAAAKKQGFKIKRLAGKDRYGTNLAILKNMGAHDHELLVANGRTFPDSLSASAVDRPLMIVGNKLTGEQISWLKLAGVNKIYIIGGKFAVSNAIQTELKKYAKTVVRVAGQDRWETSQRVANTFFSKAKKITLASGSNFPDALSGSTIAYKNNSPMFLVGTNLYGYGHQYAEEKDIRTSITIGGPAAVAQKTVIGVMERVCTKHNWKETYNTVTHKATTKKVWVVDKKAWDETVLVKEAWDEIVPIQEHVNACNECYIEWFNYGLNKGVPHDKKTEIYKGFAFELTKSWPDVSEASKEFSAHCDATGHGGYGDSWVTLSTKTVHHDATYKTVHHNEEGHYETQTVPEWSENVVSGYKCSICGETKGK